LREKLRAILRVSGACYSGRGGEVVGRRGLESGSRKTRSSGTSRTRRIKILLGTDALSEGLNLQTLRHDGQLRPSVNPMRVEQRIGRIDRIGQRYDEVWIRNYFINEGHGRGEHLQGRSKTGSGG